MIGKTIFTYGWNFWNNWNGWNKQHLFVSKVPMVPVVPNRRKADGSKPNRNPRDV
jgi:hypothetical protein